MELILVVVISAGMVENSQNGVSRSLKQHMIKLWLNEHMRSKSFLKTVQSCTFSNTFRQSVPRERAYVRK